LFYLFHKNVGSFDFGNQHSDVQQVGNLLTS